MSTKHSVRISVSVDAATVTESFFFFLMSSCMFLMSYGTKGLENDCRCFTCVCLFTEDEKLFFVFVKVYF